MARVHEAAVMAALLAWLSDADPRVSRVGDANKQRANHPSWRPHHRGSSKSKKGRR